MQNYKKVATSPRGHLSSAKYKIQRYKSPKKLKHFNCHMLKIVIFFTKTPKKSTTFSYVATIVGPRPVTKYKKGPKFGGHGCIYSCM